MQNLYVYMLYVCNVYGVLSSSLFITSNVKTIAFPLFSFQFFSVNVHGYTKSQDIFFIATCFHIVAVVSYMPRHVYID